MSIFRTIAAALVLAGTLTGTLFAGGKIDQPKVGRMKGAFRSPVRSGWIFVHLEGSPSDIGYQHGHLMAEEIHDTLKVIQLEATHDSSKDWTFFRKAGQDVLWPKIEKEYREELQGIVAGVTEQGYKLDLWDLVALNASLELGPYYVPYYDKQNGASPTVKPPIPERCSAFVATGSYTKDGKPVIAHNAWTSYMDGSRWNVMFDIAPVKGHRILMDGLPGYIHSGDDFGVNSAGMMITETTISQFIGFDPKGIPEFVRARKAMQYSGSIKEFARIMTEGNNGGYANNWLVADRKSGEIASLELGLENVTLRKSKDGYFTGSNYPENAKLVAEETDFDPKDLGVSATARRVRWTQLMEQNKGKIDAEMAKTFLADHYDSFAKKEEANERTLCGHIELSPRGIKGWWGPYGTAGAVQNKVADSNMAKQMKISAAMGHACGRNFKAKEHLEKYREYDWQTMMRDLTAYPWTEFETAR